MAKHSKVWCPLTQLPMGHCIQIRENRGEKDQKPNVITFSNTFCK